jgi:hypothetical protein
MVGTLKLRTAPVSKLVAHASNVSPGNFRVLTPERLGDVLSGFTNDFDCSYRCVYGFQVFDEFLLAKPLCKLFSGVYGIRDILDVIYILALAAHM